MPSRFERYRMVDGRTPLGERYFNAIWRDIDLRIATLEDVKIAWQAAVDEVVRFGLVRIDDLIRGPLQEVTALAEQATSTSQQLESLRQLAETRTTALTALIASLESSTQEQVSQFVADTTTATAAEIAAWKAARTLELDQWVADFEQQLNGATTGINAAIEAVQQAVAASARMKVETKAASFGVVAADTRKCFIITAAGVTISFATPGQLGAGWWCEVLNESANVAQVGALVSLRPGARCRVHCDGAALALVGLTASLERRALIGSHPGRQLLLGSIFNEAPATAPSTKNYLHSAGSVLFGIPSAVGTAYWSTTDGQNIVERAFPESAAVYSIGALCAFTGTHYIYLASANARLLRSTDAANWVGVTIAGAASAAASGVASNGAGRVLALVQNAGFLSTDHGATFAPVTLPASAAWIAAHNGLFFCGWSNQVWTSPTGATGSWTARGALASGTPQAVFSTGTRLVFTSGSNTTTWTADGVEFNSFTAPATARITGVGDVFVFFDNSSLPAVSVDAKRWVRVATAEPFLPGTRQVAPFAGQLYAFSGSSVYATGPRDFGIFERATP